MCLLEDLLVSSQDKREGGEQRGQSLGDQSGDEEEEVLGGAAGVWQRQRGQSAHKTEEKQRWVKTADLTSTISKNQRQQESGSGLWIQLLP